MLPPASERRTPRHPEYADASTWNEYNGLYLVRDWGLRGGMQQQGGDTQCSLPHSHHPPLLRARREIIPSCSGVTGTTEGGGRIEPTARATPPPPVRGERRGYAHRASCSGSAPTLSPFRWLDVVLSLPSHQVRRCGEIGGGRYVTVGLLLGRAAVSWLFWFSGPGEECSRAV